MSEDKHKPGKDGLLEDSVSYYPASPEQLRSYAHAADALSDFHAPVFVRSDNPHDRLFVAAFDGTGNDKNKDPNHATNVAGISDQVERLDDARIQVGYVAGPGTQDNLLSRAWDGMTGGTYDERLEEMYDKLVTQAKEWKAQDPEAQIRLANIGFSRGAEQAAGFARLVHERGIIDPDSVKLTIDDRGRKQAQPTGYLVPPGRVAQAEALFDPVNTGRPEARDRRPPPSVISGFQITAEDERRNKFISDRIIDPGMSADGRFLGVAVAGAHSDIGGSYHRDGLAIRSDNLMVDYLNALSDKPFLKKSAEPDDPRLNVVHRSEEGLLIYRLDRKVDRDTPHGYNALLVPRREAGSVADPYGAEPRDETLNRQFERHPVLIGEKTQPRPDRQSSAQPAAPNPTAHDMFEALYTAAANKNDDASRQVAQTYAQSQQGQALLAQGKEANRQAEPPQQTAQTQPPPQGPVLRP